MRPPFFLFRKKLLRLLAVEFLDALRGHLVLRQRRKVFGKVLLVKLNGRIGLLLSPGDRAQSEERVRRVDRTLEQLLVILTSRIQFVRAQIRDGAAQSRLLV